MICCVCSSTAAFPQSRTTSFWAITSTEESNRWRPSACCLPTRSNTRRTFSCSEETTSAPASTEYMGSTMSASGATTSRCGRRSPIASTAYRWRRSWTRRSSAATAA
uniref:(northern house mosquito) hypothetical protein n=1 Tax=Culex pipiens TaxID=7175 RepID=A0A8D8AK91_CULPI